MGRSEKCLAYTHLLMNTHCILDLKALLDLVMKVIILGGIWKLCGTNGGTSGGIKPILVHRLLIASYFESLRPLIIRTIADASVIVLIISNNFIAISILRICLLITKLLPSPSKWLKPLLKSTEF